MSKKLTKEEVRSPDSFILFSDRVVGIIERYQTLLVSLLISSVLFGFTYAGYGYLKEKQEKKKQSELYVISKAKDELEKSFSERISEKKDKEDKEPTFEDYKTIIEKYEQFVDTNLSSKASAIAATHLVDLYNKFDKKKEAETVIQKVIDGGIDGDKDNLLWGLLKIQKGMLEFSRQDYAQAAKSFEMIVQNKNLEHLHPDALLKMALSNYKSGQKEKAREQLKNLNENFDDSGSAKLASLYLRLIHLNKDK